MGFYAGRVLRVDLTTGLMRVESVPSEWISLYVGGKGLLLRYLHDELTPGTDGLSPQNPLLVFTGPFAGTTAPTCSRLAVGTKSPLTGTVVDSYVGGSFGPELKYAGFDGLILTGRAPQPTLLHINDSEVRLLSAHSYWGSSTSAIEETLRRDLDPDIKVLSIGPAGETLLPWACLSTDQYHKAGRGGAGAVMGSKNLKAVAVRGHGAVHVPDVAAFLDETRRLQTEYLFTGDNLWAYEAGTPVLVEPIHAAGALPVRNFTDGEHPGIEQVSAQALLDRRVRNRSCAQCGLACRQFHQFEGLSSEGPEFETIAICGSNCGVVDLEAIAAFNWACDELGMDTISTGAVVALAMDLHERGIADLGLRFGDVDGYIAAPQQICDGQGAGADLSLGARALAIKAGHPELAMHVKGLDMPGYDPRGSHGMAVAYATSDRGACHMRAFPIGEEVLAGSLPADSLEGKPELVIRLQDYCSVCWTGIWCSNWATTPEILIRHFRHLWGRDCTEVELLRIGARIWNLGRLINVREGFRASDDTLPERMLEGAHEQGGAAGKVIGKDSLEAALQEYYSARGWTPDGVPTKQTLTDLGVDDALAGSIAEEVLRV